MKSPALLALLMIAACSSPTPDRSAGSGSGATPATPSDVGYTFTGRLLRVSMASGFSGEVLPTTRRDARWILEFQVVAVLQGRPPAEPGQRVAYAVHSLSLSLAAEKIGADYRVTSTPAGGPDQIPIVLFEGP